MKKDKKKLNWNKFEYKDGSIYFWKYDDRRIAIRSGLDNIIWLNLQILHFLEAELSIRRSLNNTVTNELGNGYPHGCKEWQEFSKKKKEIRKYAHTKTKKSYWEGMSFAFEQALSLVKLWFNPDWDKK